MSSLGLYGGFPFEFGGGEPFVEAEHLALLEALEPGWDGGEDTEHWIECFAHAVALHSIWSCSGRIAGQAIPMRMLEALPTWEEASKLRPFPGETDIERRRQVAARFLGIVSNAFPAIYDACVALIGSTFVGLLTVPASQVVAYWPGGTPGPPGYEWSSNRAQLQVQVTKAMLNDVEFRTQMNALTRMLDTMLPAWMSFDWHTGSGFILGESILDEAAL